MAGPIRIAILANASQANRELEQTATTAEKISGKMSKLRAPAIAALGAIGIGAKKAITSATDLNEAVSKSGVIFGKQKGEIDKFAAGAATSLGQSKTAALGAASTFGMIAQKAGLGGGATADFSKKFTTLASDLASFNNTSPEEAVEALTSAMRGEAEPIRKYGVMLDDATLKARALKMGLIANTKQALTPQQKALAASREIMAQTSKAQGDFQRTADGAANKQRIVAAQAENLSASLGQALLPAYEAALSIASRFVAIMAKNPGVVKVAIAALAGLAVVILTASAASKIHAGAIAIHKGAMLAARGATVAWAIAQRILNGVMRANPIGLAITAIMALVGVFIAAYRKSETFRRIVDKSWAAIKRATAAVWGFLKKITVATWNAIKGAITNPARTASSILRAAWNAIKGATRAVWNAIRGVISGVWRSITSNVRGAVGNVKNWIGDAWGWVKSKTADLWGDFVSTIRDKIGDAVDFVKGIKSKITGAFSGAGSWLVNIGENILDGLVRGIETARQWVIDKIRAVTDSIPNWVKDRLGISSPSKVFDEIGRNIGRGLVRGLDRERTKVRGTAARMAQDVERGFRTPRLTLNAATPRLAPAGAGGLPPVSITVNVPPTADKAAIGREVAGALDAYYRQGGRRRA